MELLAFLLAFPIVLAIGVLLGRNYESFIAGVKAVAVAALVSVLVSLIASPVPNIPYWVGFVVVPPLIEESARFFFMKRSAFLLNTPRAWWMFGLGFGLVEGVSKLLRAALNVAEGEWAPVMLLAWISPTLLHVALTLIGCLAVRAGLPLAAALFLTIALHAGYNWTVVNATSLDLVQRIVLLGCIIGSVLSWARRFTTPPPHANTPAHD